MMDLKTRPTRALKAGDKADGKPVERPILMAGEMVRATLADRKTQTRRLVKLVGAECIEERDGGRLWPWSPQLDDWIAGPYEDGMRLWVRETWSVCLATGDCAQTIADAKEWHPASPGYSGNHLGEARYAATDGLPDADARWFPSIHMPRWASRLTLAVTSVRVERLQTITEEDARAEGVEPYDRVEQSFAGGTCPGETALTHPHKMAFAILWDTLYGDKVPWVKNPFVWRVEFWRLERP